jgi:hypothetical protein
MTVDGWREVRDEGDCQFFKIMAEGDVEQGGGLRGGGGGALEVRVGATARGKKGPGSGFIRTEIWL